MDNVYIKLCKLNKHKPIAISTIIKIFNQMINFIISIFENMN